MLSSYHRRITLILFVFNIARQCKLKSVRIVINNVQSYDYQQNANLNSEDIYVNCFSFKHAVHLLDVVQLTNAHWEHCQVDMGRAFFKKINAQICFPYEWLPNTIILQR